MGLPIRRLILATNENDVLDEFFRTGRYRPRGTARDARDVVARRWTSPRRRTSSASSSTSSAAIPRVVRELWAQLARDGGFDLAGDAVLATRRSVRASSPGASTHADRIATIRDVDARYGVVVDPHTADGLKVGRERRDPAVPLVCIETALPVKFGATIREALGREPARPAALRGSRIAAAALRVLPRRRRRGQGVHRGARGRRLMRRSAFAPWRYALANLLRNLRAGLRLACFLRVERLAFRIDLAQLLLLFVAVGADRHRWRLVPRRAAAASSRSRARAPSSIPARCCCSRRRVIALAQSPARRRAGAAGDRAVVVARRAGRCTTSRAWLALGPIAAELLGPFEYRDRDAGSCSSWCAAWPWRSRRRRRSSGCARSAADCCSAADLVRRRASSPNEPWWRGAADERASERRVPCRVGGGAGRADLSARRTRSTSSTTSAAARPISTSSASRRMAARTRTARTSKPRSTSWIRAGAPTAARCCSSTIRRTLITTPFATVTNLRETLNEIGGDHRCRGRRRDALPREPRQPRSTARGRAAAARAASSSAPAGLQAAARRRRHQVADHRRVGVLFGRFHRAACGRLHADRDRRARPSTRAFGCGSAAPPTFFGDAFFQQGLGKSDSFEAAFDVAKARVAERERDGGLHAAVRIRRWSMGAAMADKMKTLRKRGARRASHRAKRAARRRG